MIDLILPDEIPEIPTITVENITLSDGIEIAVKDFPEGSTSIDYRRVNGGYGGDCLLSISVSGQENAWQEIKDALEIELVSKTKVDPVSKQELIEAMLAQQFAIQQAGFTCSNGVKLQVEDDDLINWTQLMAGITAFAPETVVIRDYNNINHTVTSTEATQMMQEVFAWGQWLFQDTWAKKDAIINE